MAEHMDSDVCVFKFKYSNIWIKWVGRQEDYIEAFHLTAVRVMPNPPARVLRRKTKMLLSFAEYRSIAAWNLNTFQAAQVRWRSNAKHIYIDNYYYYSYFWVKIVEVPQNGNHIDIPGVQNHESSHRFVHRSIPLLGDSLPGDLASLWTANPHHLVLFSNDSIAVWPLKISFPLCTLIPKNSPRFKSYGLFLNGIGRSNNVRLINRHPRSFEYPTSISFSGIVPGKRLVRDAQLPLVLARVCQPAPSFLSFERGASQLGLKYCHPVDMQSYVYQDIRKKVASRTTNLLTWRVTSGRHVRSYCAPYDK